MKKILFLVLNIMSHRTPEENLGVYYLVQALKDNDYKAEFIDAWLENLTMDQLIARINDEDIAAIGISSCINNVKEIQEFMGAMNNEIPVFVGGYGGTFSIDELLNIGCDMVVIGEGDKKVIDIAKFYVDQTVQKKSINGIAYKDFDKIIYTDSSPQYIDLDSLPLPVRPYLQEIIKRKSTVNVLSSKGCRGNCIFCSINSFYKNTSHVKWRGMSISKIVNDLKHLYDQGARVFKFVDDSFIEDERDENWCREFSEQILKNGMKDILFRISIRADKVTDEKIKHLKKAGLFAVSCGIENGSDSFLRRIRKASTKELNCRALSIFKKYSIYVQAGYILFDKDTSYEELVENLHFIKENKWIITKGIFTELYAGEGTEYTEKLKRYSKCNVKVNGNYQYKIDNQYVKIIYDSLKKWHKYQAAIYDKVIDPISAPKALRLEEYKEFYDLYLIFREKDINVFEWLITHVKILDKESIIREMEATYIQHQEWLTEFMKKIDRIYDKCGLVYDASENMFL